MPSGEVVVLLMCSSVLSIALGLILGYFNDVKKILACRASEIADTEDIMEEDLKPVLCRVDRIGAKHVRCIGRFGAFRLPIAFPRQDIEEHGMIEGDWFHWDRQGPGISPHKRLQQRITFIPEADLQAFLERGKPLDEILDED